MNNWPSAITVNNYMYINICLGMLLKVTSGPLKWVCIILMRGRTGTSRGRTRPNKAYMSMMGVIRDTLSIEQPPCVTLGTKNEYCSSAFDLCQLVHFGPGHVTGWGFGSRGYVRCWAGQCPGGTSLRPPRPNGHSGGELCPETPGGHD